MERFYDEERIREDVSRAIEEALRHHGLTSFSLPGLCGVLEAIASGLKYQANTGRIGRDMGRLGLATYQASHLVRKVSILLSPHSLVVSPLMECIALALARRGKPIANADLERETLRIHLDKPRLTTAGVARAQRQDPSLAPAFLSARAYLLEGEVIVQDGDGGAWRLADLLASGVAMAAQYAQPGRAG